VTGHADAGLGGIAGAVVVVVGGGAIGVGSELAGASGVLPAPEGAGAAATSADDEGGTVAMVPSSVALAVAVASPSATGGMAQALARSASRKAAGISVPRVVRIPPYYRSSSRLASAETELCFRTVAVSGTRCRDATPGAPRA
jgi:hypothetical protein